MKKIVSITMAAVCALSFAAFGLSACGEKKSDEVTAEEWTAAMSAYNALNATINCTCSGTATRTKDSTTETSQMSVEAVVKSALTINGTHITGNAYIYSSETEADSDGSETETGTMYEVFLEDSYSSVTKYEYKTSTINYLTGETEETVDADWDGEITESAATPNDSYAFYTCKQAITMISGSYEDFVYTDGAYKYTEADSSSSSSSSGTDSESSAVYVKINDGKLTSIVAELDEEYTFGSYTYKYDYRYEFKFSDYGKTSVTVPEEYTYEYYYLNYEV